MGIPTAEGYKRSMEASNEVIEYSQKIYDESQQLYKNIDSLLENTAKADRACSYLEKRLQDGPDGLVFVKSRTGKLRTILSDQGNERHTYIRMVAYYTQQMEQVAIKIEQQRAAAEKALSILSVCQKKLTEFWPQPTKQKE